MQLFLILFIHDCRGSCTELTSIGDYAGAADLRSAKEFARGELGVSELKIVSDFPIALCAVGYTRITRDPNRSVLTPFETSANGRVPSTS